jgi:hypothetical protein
MSIPLYPVSASDGESEVDLLAQRMTDIRNWAKSDSGLGDTQYGDRWSQLYYPAVSACYAFEPKVSKANENLDVRFCKHNWFLPTAGMLARVWWYQYRRDNGLSIRDDSPFAEAILKGIFERMKNSLHWSITEGGGGNQCWNIFFNSGGINNSGKDNLMSVRAVCAF